ncbi:hypothetical protein TEA_011232 [Camellia sinensis var. sinensis]|uniref:Uncharacterized protein n=1 Tax=Camellia sinensis var. sinensis TaxID=542762 RepID=A0A4S4DQB2_CAMSN|nr:hypothetical protein TEA_011232 [Camellia sinensis var. sinensis]
MNLSISLSFSLKVRSLPLKFLSLFLLVFGFQSTPGFRSSSSLLQSQSVWINPKDVKTRISILFWHGGSAYDAWFSCASYQVAQVLLTLPYSFSQCGTLSRILFLLFYGLLGVSPEEGTGATMSDDDDDQVDSNTKMFDGRFDEQYDEDRVFVSYLNLTTSAYNSYFPLPQMRAETMPPQAALL